MSDNNLILLNKVLHHTPFAERQNLIALLDQCLLPDAGAAGEPLWYRVNKARLEIFKAIKGRPLLYVKYVALMTTRDVRDRALFGKIAQGVQAYIKTSPEKRQALKSSLLSQWTLRNMLARSFGKKPYRF